MIDLAVGITTYNRPEIVRYCAKSISNVQNVSKLKILIIDDCSTEYDINFLKKIFPPHSVIIQNKTNTGSADIAIRNIMDALIHLNTEHILLLDSDMIIRSDFLNIVEDIFNKTDGVLSLFNTPNHRIINSEEVIVQKNTAGSAGTIFRIDIAKKIIENISEGGSFDFRYCKFLNENNIKIFSLESSAVQHLGLFGGQNANLYNGDIGIGFSDIDLNNAYLLVEFLLFENQKIYKFIKNGTLSVKLKNIRNYIRKVISKKRI